jgi:acylphosphatase
MQVVRRYRVSGRVQGVGFRWFVREQARSLGLHGWVRNEPDGAVVLVAAGPLVAVSRLESALAAGPEGARVTEVVHRELTPFDADGLSFPFASLR